MIILIRRRFVYVQRILIEVAMSMYLMGVRLATKAHLVEEERHLIVIR